MTKNLIVALVAVMAVGQLAHANREKDAKPEGVKREQAREAKSDAKTTATHGADASPQQTSSTIRSSVAGAKLNSDQISDLKTAVANSKEVEAIVNEIIRQGQNPQLAELAQARLAAVAVLKDVKGGSVADTLANLSQTAKLEKAYRDLAFHSGEQAVNWSDAERKNLTALLVRANAASKNKSPADALAEAMADIAKPVANGGLGVKLDIDQVNKFCGKKA